jgi:Protein of unknown function (DUF4199)
MENITVQQRNKMAATYGLLTGIIYIVITSGVNVLTDNFLVFYLMKFVGYMAYFVIIGVFASKIRKANGGFMEFREVFGAVFIMILIAATISFLYTYLYMFVIDPHFMEKIKASTGRFMIKMNVPQEKMDESMRKFDQQMEESKHFNLKNNILSLLGAYLVDSLFGLLVSVIVKKSRPVFR